jgi:hypothetical protein
VGWATHRALAGTGRDRGDLFPAVEVCGDPRSPSARDRGHPEQDGILLEIGAARQLDFVIRKDS